jgi:hypothetical protein
MHTTTTMMPITEAIFATGPSCFGGVRPLPGARAAPAALAREAWAAGVCRTAARAGGAVTIVSQNSGARRAMTVVTAARGGRTEPLGRRRSVEDIVLLHRAVHGPVLLQQGIAVGVVLCAADPLPAA